MKIIRLSTLAVYVTILIALVYAGCKSEQKIALTFSPQKGTKYEFLMNMEQDVEMEQMGQKINSSNTMDFTYLMDVKNKDANNNTVIVATFKRIRFSTVNPMMNMEYDSDKPATDANPQAGMMAKVFNSMLNKTVTISVNDKGEVIAIEGMEEIFTGMINDLGLDSVPDAASVVSQIKSQFSNEQFKKTFDEMFRILPGKEVNIGESWDVIFDKNMMGMDMKSKNTYTLKDMKDKNAVVGVLSNIDITKSGDEMQGGEMKMTGTQNGTLTIDTETGLTLQSTIEQDITSTTTSMGMEMPMKMKGKITITSKEIK